MSDNSRERLAELFHRQLDNEDDYTPEVLADIAVRFLAEAGPKGEATPQWISIEDHSPTESGEFLVASEAGVETADYFLGSMSWESVRTYGQYCESRTLHHVTYWMPLPSAPASTKRESGSAK